MRLSVVSATIVGSPESDVFFLWTATGYMVYVAMLAVAAALLCIRRRQGQSRVPLAFVMMTLGFQLPHIFGDADRHAFAATLLPSTVTTLLFFALMTWNLQQTSNWLYEAFLKRRERSTPDGTPDPKVR